MSIESALHAYLASVLSVGDRVSPMGKRSQKGLLPWVTYQLVSGPGSHYAHSGVSDHEASYQLDCWADDADDAMDLDDEVRMALDGYRGEWSGYRIGSVFTSVVLDDPEPKSGLYRRIRQVDIHYSSPAGS